MPRIHQMVTGRSPRPQLALLLPSVSRHLTLAIHRRLERPVCRLPPLGMSRRMQGQVRRRRHRQNCRSPTLARDRRGMRLVCRFPPLGMQRQVRRRRHRQNCRSPTLARDRRGMHMQSKRRRNTWMPRYHRLSLSIKDGSATSLISRLVIRSLTISLQTETLR